MASEHRLGISWTGAGPCFLTPPKSSIPNQAFRQGAARGFWEEPDTRQPRGIQSEEPADAALHAHGRHQGRAAQQV